MTLNDWPAIVTVQVRVPPVLLADAVTVTEPLPVPVLGETVSHELHGLLTLQAHPLPAVTLTVVLPPAAGALQLASEIE